MKYRSSIPLYDSGQWLFKALTTCHTEGLKPLPTKSMKQPTKQQTKTKKKDVVKIMVCGCGEIFVEGVGCGKCRQNNRILRS
jgi:hypothetical protein